MGDHHQDEAVPPEDDRTAAAAHDDASTVQPVTLSAPDDATNGSSLEAESSGYDQSSKMEPAVEAPATFRSDAMSDPTASDVLKDVEAMEAGSDESPAAKIATALSTQEEERDGPIGIDAASAADNLNSNTEDLHSRRSSAPSPSPKATLNATASASSEAETPTLPPVVVSPSSPRSPDIPLVSPSLSNDVRYQPPPRLHRLPSQDEKEEAIRLVRELRSEPSTPAIEEAESTIGPSSGAHTPAHFSFDLTEQMKDRLSLTAQGDSSHSKRKRGKDDVSVFNTGNAEEDGAAGPSDEGHKDKKQKDTEAPSLTLSIFSGSILPRKQLVLSVLASLGINLCLPFVNGVMLGLGEIFARDWMAPFFRFTFGKRDSAGGQGPRSSTLGTSGVGLRSAGSGSRSRSSSTRGGAQDVPGHAGAKTAIETLTENAAAGAGGL